MGRPPPGYVRAADGIGIVLIDPPCPRGHRMLPGKFQRGHTSCGAHQGHPHWTCQCGQRLWLMPDGSYVTELSCLRAETMPRL